jgi:hypothetical protein
MIGSDIMVNWTKEDVEFITNSIVMPCMMEYNKEVVEKIFETHLDSEQEVLEAQIDAMNKVNYTLQKEIMFLRHLVRKLYSMNNMSDETLDRWYQDYCDKFDELNKATWEEK